MSINKVIIDDYLAGASLPELCRRHGIPVSTLRNRILKAGVLRGRSEAVRIAASQGKLGRPGVRRIFSSAHRENISAARRRTAETTAKGVSLKASGYAEFTRGSNKGRSVHVVLMETRLGRRLLPDEVVHHIDGNRSNNSVDNLALMTRSGHTRLHRRENLIKGGQ